MTAPLDDIAAELVAVRRALGAGRRARATTTMAAAIDRLEAATREIAVRARRRRR